MFHDKLAMKPGFEDLRGNVGIVVEENLETSSTVACSRRASPTVAEREGVGVVDRCLHRA